MLHVAEPENIPGRAIQMSFVFLSNIHLFSKEKFCSIDFDSLIHSHFISERQQEATLYFMQIDWYVVVVCFLFFFCLFFCLFLFLFFCMQTTHPWQVTQSNLP